MVWLKTQDMQLIQNMKIDAGGVTMPYYWKALRVFLFATALTLMLLLQVARQPPSTFCQSRHGMRSNAMYKVVHVITSSSVQPVLDAWAEAIKVWHCASVMCQTHLQASIA